MMSLWAIYCVERSVPINRINGLPAMRKTASTLGIILTVLGIISLAYYSDPVRFMIRDLIPHKTNPLPRILGVLALVGGGFLLFATRSLDTQ